jgi:Protein of unknown function (DUF1579)
MRLTGLIFAAWLTLGAAALAQSEPPKPAPELKKLDVLAGSWTVDGDVKPGPMGPGGKMSESEKCDWMEGGYFLVCNVDFKSAMGNGSGISIMGYSKDDKAYTYREFNSWGEAVDSTGSIDGNTWTWTNEEKMGDKMVKGKFTMKMTSSTSYDFTYETSGDGSKWTLVVDGKAAKK